MTASPGSEIPKAAPVHTADGAYLGVVVSISQHVLIVERGWLERRGYVIPGSQIAGFEGGVVLLSRTLAEITGDGRFR